MDGHDKIFEIKAQLQAVRYNRKLILSNKEKERVEHEGRLDDQDNEDMEVNDEEQNSDQDIAIAVTEVDGGMRWDLNYEPPMDRRSEFVILHIPKRIMQCEEITSAADRLRLSDNQTTMIVSAVIKAAGGNLDDFDISRSTSRRSRMLNRQKIAENVIDSVRLNPPQFGALHWDGKLLKDIVGEQHEQLAVLVSGAPEYSEGKLLGVPALSDSKGKTQANATLDLLEAWDLSDNVVALVFDTTASNSGIHNGAAKLIEESLGRKLLYLACRHHILEIFVGAVWKKLFGNIFGPENKFFANFKASWPTLDKELPIETLEIEGTWLQTIKEQTIKHLTHLLANENAATFPRDDYRECAENTLIIFGQTPPRGVHFLKPGAIHQARWMACNIYAGKMFMFSRQMPYDEEMKIKLFRMNRFLSLFHTPAWTKASIGADAPFNDLQLIHDMMDFKEIDKEVADVILSKMNNHRWYLTEEVVPFAFFSKHVSSSVKLEMAAKLLEIPVPESFRLGKPVFRKITRQTGLANLLGPESHTLFSILGINTDWLAKPIHQWTEHPGYQETEKFVCTVKVVNDTAERGVKLISEFATIITSDPQQRAWLLQGVESHRQQYPDFDKKTLGQ